jgi:hypothetical protein
MSTRLGASRGSGSVEVYQRARGRIDLRRNAPAGGAVNGRAGVEEGQPVEVGVALHKQQGLRVRAGHRDVVEHDVADGMGDVMAVGLVAGDLDAEVGIEGVGDRAVAAMDGDILDQRIALEVEQADVAGTVP